MSDHDNEVLPPTPGARVSKFLGRTDVKQTVLLGAFFTAVFVVLGVWVYPKWMPMVLTKQMQAGHYLDCNFCCICNRCKCLGLSCSNH